MMAIRAVVVGGLMMIPDAEVSDIWTLYPLPDALVAGASYLKG